MEVYVLNAHSDNNEHGFAAAAVYANEEQANAARDKHLRDTNAEWDELAVVEACYCDDELQHGDTLHVLHVWDLYDNSEYGAYRVCKTREGAEEQHASILQTLMAFWTTTRGVLLETAYITTSNAVAQVWQLCKQCIAAAH